MKLIRNAFAASLVVAATVMACSSQHESGGTTAGNGNTGVGSVEGQKGETGKVGAALSLASGVSLTSLNWTISNGANSYTGTVHIGDAESVEWVAGGILAGSGYTLTVSGTDSRGDACVGSTSTTFSVGAGATTGVILSVVCTIPSDAATAADVQTGSVAVDGSVTLVNQGAVACPGITSFSIDPAEQLAGVPVQLNLSTTGPASVITWSVSGGATSGTFSSTSIANPTFTCLAGGTPMTITATIALSDSGACTGETFTTMSAPFTCEAAGSALPCSVLNPALPNACTGADGGQTCVNFTSDPSNCGSCGHVCAAATPSCQASVCVSQPPTACTTAPCAASGPNSVRCQFNTTGVCSPTEAAIVTHDVSKGLSSAGNSGANSCYSCLANFGCINDTQFGDTNHECEDSLAVGTAAQCETTLACILSTNCAALSPSICYCGTAGLLTTCQGNPAPGPINGACATQIAAGLGFAVTDGTDNTAQLTSTTFASGKADQIFQCALTNNCASCQN